jgi:membrane protease YdiL (CAAX protease family)
MPADQPPARTPAVRIGDAAMHVDTRTAALTWLGCWLAGNVVAAAVITAGGGAETPTPIWAVAVAATCLWVPMLIALSVLGRRFGTADLRADYGLSMRAIDLIGVPIGVLSQLVLVPLLYLPLESLWPSAFGSSDRERNARDLYDSANGAWLVVLVVVVVIGAPLVEELVYRGLLQGAMIRRVDDTIAVVAVAAWFALIHFRPVEYPGLFAFGLVLGLCAQRTRRLGMSVIAHVAFNATGLILVAR